MTILPANAAHIPGMISLLRQVGQVHRDIRPDLFREGVQKYNEADLTKLLTDESCPIFIAEEDGKVVGYCFCQWRIYSGNPVLTDRKELYIDDLCVDEAARGTGVASRLYRHVIAYAREQGCAYITLNVWCGNLNAQRFYEHMGMQQRSITMEMPLEDTKC